MTDVNQLELNFKSIKVYAAGPFFKSEQLETMKRIEAILSEFNNIDVYRPRDGAASALKLNVEIAAGKDPSATTRRAVYQDNVDNISDAQLLVALIDDRDVGTIFEMGWAAARGIPIVTFTERNYGVNLMLAESVLAHARGVDQLREVIDLFVRRHAEICRGDVAWDDVCTEFDQLFKRANLSEVNDADKSTEIYRKYHS